MKLAWKNIFERKFTEVIGLDIGSSSVKIVQLKRERNDFVVTSAARVNITAVTSAEHITDDSIKTIRAIRDCLSVSAATGQFSVCGLCGPEVAVRKFHFPPLPADEVNGAIMLEAAQVCPFNVNESTIDYQLIPNGPESTRGVLAAATDRLIKEKQWLAEEALLKTVLMDIDGLALLNCLRECGKLSSNRSVAVLNVGNLFTTLVIIGNDNMPFIRDIAYAGANIVGRLADKYNINAQDLQKILSGQVIAQHDQVNLPRDLPEAADRLIDDVSETLRYYAANEKTAVEEIYLSGGTALIEGFLDLLKTKFSAKVNLWNPFIDSPIRPVPQLADFLQKNGPAFAVAAGLAMRTI